MSITRRSSNGVVEYFDGGTGATSRDVDLSDAAVGDVRILILSINQIGTAASLAAGPTISGWTELFTSTAHGGASNGRISGFYRVVQSGDTLTSATQTVALSVANSIGAVCVTLEGVDTGTPIDQTAPTPSTGSHPISSPSITTQTDGAWVFSCGVQDGTTGAIDDTDVPGGMTVDGTMNNNPPSNGMNLGVAHVEQATAGASGAKTWQTNTGTEERVGAAFAIRPSSGAAATPDEFDMDAGDVDIDGEGFEASQGTGTVYISDADTLAGSANEVEIANGINTWADAQINLDLTGLNATERDNLNTLGPGARYVIVVNDSAEEQAAEITLHRAHAFQMSASGNITDTGEATTFQLLAPATKTTGDFGGGRITDLENPDNTTVDLAVDEYREDEWCLEAKTLAEDAQYQFRVLMGGEVIGTYTVDPRWTVTSALAVTGGTIASGSTLYPPTVEPPAAEVTGGTIASTVALYAPTLVQTIVAATIASTLVLFAPTVAAEAAEVTGATIPSTVALYEPTVEPQAVPITGGTIGGPATIAVVQQADNSADEALEFDSSTTVSFDSATSAGNAIVVKGYAYDPGGAPANLTITDNKSNVYTNAVVEVGQNVRLAIAYCLNPTMGSGHTVTIASTSSPFATGGVAVEVSNVAAYEDSNSNSGTGTSGAPGAVTAAPGDWMLAGCSVDSEDPGNATWAGSSELCDNDFNVTNAKLEAAGGSNNPTWSFTSDPWAAVIARFSALRGTAVLYPPSVAAVTPVTGGTIGGTATITEVGSGATNNGSGTAVSITHGLSPQAGDVVIAVVHANDASGTQAIADNNGGTPFTELFEEDHPGGGDSSTYAVYRRVAGASEPSSYAWTLDDPFNWTVQVRVFRGVDNASPEDVTPSASTRSFGFGTTASAPSVDVSAGALGIVVFVSDSTLSGGWSSPSNSYGDEVENTAANSQASYIRLHGSAGGTGAVTATQASNDWIGQHFALKPALAGGSVLYPPSVSPGAVAVTGGTIGAPATPAHNASAIGSDTFGFDVEVTLPSYQAGDACVVLIVSTHEELDSLPSGFSYHDQRIIYGSTYGRLASKVLTGSEGASVTFTGTTDQSDSEYFVVIIRGSSGFESFTYNDGNDTTSVFLSITTAADNAGLLAFGIYAGGAGFSAWSSPLTEYQDNGSLAIAFGVQAAQGASGDKTATHGFQAWESWLVEVNASLGGVAVVFPPTVAVGAVDVTAGTVASTAVLYEPTITTGAVAVTGGTIASTVVLYEPTVSAGPVPITGAHIASTATLYEPTVDVGDVSVTGGTIATGVALYEPTVTQEGAILGAHIASTVALYEPTVSTGAVTVVGAHIASTIALYEPTVALGSVDQFVTAAHIASTLVLHEPTITTGAVAVTGGTIASGLVLYEPTISAGAVSVTGGTIASTATLFEPTISTGAVAVTGGTIASGVALYPPLVSTGALVVLGAHIASTAALFEPSVAAGPVAVTGAHISSGVALYEPTVSSGAAAITTAHISSGVALYEPTVSLEGAIVGAHIASTTVLYPPTLTAGAVAVTGGHVASTLALFAPTLAQVVQTSHIASGAALYPPGVALGPVAIAASHIPSTAVLYAPQIEPGPVAAIGAHITSGVVLFPPELEVTIFGAHIASGSALFAPTVATGAAAVVGAHIASTAALFGPTITIALLEPSPRLILVPSRPGHVRTATEVRRVVVPAQEKDGEPTL